MSEADRRSTSVEPLPVVMGKREPVAGEVGQARGRSSTGTSTGRIEAGQKRPAPSSMPNHKAPGQGHFPSNVDSRSERLEPDFTSALAQHHHELAM